MNDDISNEDVRAMNDPAFPVLGQCAEGDEPPALDLIHSGMTLADYFAGQALAGRASIGEPEESAEWAYRAAVAMLKQKLKNMEAGNL